MGGSAFIPQRTQERGGGLLSLEMSDRRSRSRSRRTKEWSGGKMEGCFAAGPTLVPLLPFPWLVSLVIPPLLFFRPPPPRVCTRRTSTCKEGAERRRRRRGRRRTTRVAFTGRQNKREKKNGDGEGEGMLVPLHTGLFSPSSPSPHTCLEFYHRKGG